MSINAETNPTMTSYGKCINCKQYCENGRNWFDIQTGMEGVNYTHFKSIMMQAH